MSLSTATVFGRRAMNRVTAADYVEWATGMLTNGQDSPNLRMLAGLDERGSVFEAEEHSAKHCVSCGFRSRTQQASYEHILVTSPVRFWTARLQQRPVSERFTRFVWRLTMLARL